MLREAGTSSIKETAGWVRLKGEAKVLRPGLP